MSPPVSHDAVGLVVAGRYRLVAHVGTGPSATVYLADDVRLRRRVAVKLLDAALGEEAGFVARFRTEMQMAAALRHPHIGVIHDWGVANEPFVVGDYHDHGSLADLVDRGILLDPPQVLQIALAGARALTYAHERGVVHRDVKPSNLLFADDGRLQIVDFGLARAYAEGASTRPMRLGGSGLDFVAPEQARGGTIDGRADVYAFVLTLIEATTGHRPFAARGAGGLDQRMGRPPAIPPTLGVLGKVLARGSTVDPADRLDAGGLVTALMAVAGSYPEAEPLPLRHTRFGDDPGPGGDIEARDITIIAAPGAVAAGVEDRAVPGDADDGGDDAVPAVGDPGPDEALPVAPDPVAPGDEVAEGEDDRGPLGRGRSDDGGSDDGGSDPDRGEPDTDGEGERGRRRWRIAWLVLLVVLLAGGGVVTYLVVQAQRTPTHLVPDVEGLTPDVARARLVELGFDVRARHVRRDGTTAGELLGVEPASGTRLAEGRPVTLVVSDGRPLVTVPGDLQGMGEDDAVERLEGLGLVVDQSDERYSEDVDSGLVIGTEPGAGKQLEKGSSLDLVISKGPEPRVVPSVAGMGPGEAEAVLADMGLVAEVTERYDVAVDKGGLIGLDPAPGTTVPRGAKVQVIVSKGLLVAVPDLGGVTTVAGAIEKLQGAGLVADALGGSGSLSGQPVAFDPPAGELVPKGSTIDIVVR